ncbi:MAG TPA: N-formylglutamate amidohydrolase [Rhizomicrobium sp.]|jgi:N-formylglutamate deformylase
MAASDIVLEDLRARPFRLVLPDIQRVPFIFASPHSGSLYPQSLVAMSRLSPRTLRRSEDAFVDELFDAANAFGAPMIAARFPRAYLDVNRSPAEIDIEMFDGALAMATDPASPRVTAGLGVIPRVVRDGAEIYRHKLPSREAEERLASFYRPYHAALATLAKETLARFGTAVVIDCHSMPSAAAVPDIVLGDRYGMSAAPLLVRHAERAFEAQGFACVRNVPYAGGYTTLLHGRPARGLHALQIEINRSLYLNEERIERTARFGQIQERIGTAAAALASIDIGFLRPGGRRETPWAAE